MFERMVDSSFYYQYPSQHDFKNWWSRYVRQESDYRDKIDTGLFPYVLEAAPRRWYSRYVINLFTPVTRDTIKFFLPISVDYESILIGTAFGLFVTFRHFLDYHLCKTPEFRPGESVCCGKNCHYFFTWKTTHVNPKKFFRYDRRLFYRKLMTALPVGLAYGLVTAGLNHLFLSQNFTWIGRHYALFIGSGFVLTYDLFLTDRNVRDVDIHYNFYRHPELYALVMLLFYNVCRRFRNYSANIPFKTVLIG